MVVLEAGCLVLAGHNFLPSADTLEQYPTHCGLWMLASSDVHWRHSGCGVLAILYIA